MSDYNNIPISDDEIAALLKAGLMEKDQDDVLTKNLIDMNAKLVFATEPVVFISSAKEQELISKLQKNFVNIPNLKWLWGGIGTVILVGIAVLINNIDPSTVKNEKVIPVTTHISVVKEAVNPESYSETSTPIEKPATPAFAAEKNTEPKQSFVSVPFLNDESETEIPPAIASVSQTGRAHRSFQNKYDGDYKSINDSFAGIKRIEITTSICDLNIKTIDGNLVYATGKLNYEFKGVALRKPEYEILYERKDSLLKVTIRNKNKSPILIAGSSDFQNILNFEVPQKTEVVIKNSSGDITAEGLNGSVCHIESSHGDIKATNLWGNIHLLSISGDIDMATANGKLRCESQHGNVTLSDLTGTLKLNSSSGDIKIHNAIGNATLVCGHGDVNLKTLSGDLSLTCNSGNIFMNDLKGNINVNSRHGDIQLTDFLGNLSFGTTSGNITGKNIELVKYLIGKCTFGDIHMTTKNKTDDLSFHIISKMGDLKIKKTGLNLNGTGELSTGKGEIIITTETQSGNQLFD